MNASVQWKGTDVCMDFHCSCGHHNHYDDYFAYYIECSNCGKVFKCDPTIQVEEVENPEGLHTVKDETDLEY